MEIKTLAKLVEVDETLQKHIDTRIGTLDRLMKNTDNIFCDLTIGKNSGSHKQGKIYFAEAKIKTAKKNYGARAESETLIDAIDELKDELSKKIRRHKDKKVSMRNKGGRWVKDLLKKIKK